MEKGHAHTHRQNGHTTPGNAAHAGYTTATARAARQPPSRDAHRDTHAASLTRMQDPPCPAAQELRTRPSAAPRRGRHATSKKNATATLKNAEDPPQKKNSSRSGVAMKLPRDEEARLPLRRPRSLSRSDLRSSGRARHDPSPKRHTSSCRAARAGGAKRAHRSPLPAARALRARRAKATQVALHPPSARPKRSAVSGQGLLLPERQQEQQQEPALRDARQHGRGCASAGGWVRVRKSHRCPAAGRQLHDDAVVDDEHLDDTNQVDVPPQERGDPSRVVGRTRSHALPRTRQPDPASSGHRNPRPWSSGRDGEASQRRRKSL